MGRRCRHRLGRAAHNRDAPPAARDGSEPAAAVLEHPALVHGTALVDALHQLGTAGSDRAELVHRALRHLDRLDDVAADTGAEPELRDRLASVREDLIALGWHDASGVEQVYAAALGVHQDLLAWADNAEGRFG